MKDFKAQHDKHKSYGTASPNLRFLVHKGARMSGRRAGKKDKGYMCAGFSEAQ